jgi:hypothetical protein
MSMALPPDRSDELIELNVLDGLADDIRAFALRRGFDTDACIGSSGFRRALRECDPGSAELLDELPCSQVGYVQLTMTLWPLLKRWGWIPSFSVDDGA